MKGVLIESKIIKCNIMNRVSGQSFIKINLQDLWGCPCCLLVNEDEFANKRK